MANKVGNTTIDAEDIYRRMRNYYRGISRISRLKRSPYIPTNIMGFDELLRGGLLLPFFLKREYTRDNRDNQEPQGGNNSEAVVKESKYDTDSLVILIKGKPGTGKTTFATQMLMGILECNKSDALHESDKPLRCQKKYNPDTSFLNQIQNTVDILNESKELRVYTCEQKREEFIDLMKRLHRRDDLREWYFTFVCYWLGVFIYEYDSSKRADIVDFYINHWKVEKVESSFTSQKRKIVGYFSRSMNSRRKRKPSRIFEIKNELSEIIVSRRDVFCSFLDCMFDDMQNNTKREYPKIAEKVKNHLMTDIRSIDPWAFKIIDYICEMLCKQDDSEAKNIKDFIDRKIEEYIEKRFDTDIRSMLKEIETLETENSQSESCSYDTWLSDMMYWLGDGPEDGTQAQVQTKEQEPENKNQASKQVPLRKRAILIDGLNTFPADIRRNIDAQLIVRYLRRRAWISIIIYEDETNHHENLDYLADMVIQIEGKEHKKQQNYYLNRICIEKSRFQQSVLGWHQYKIRESGIQVFPSLHYRTHRLDKLDDYIEYSEESILQDYTDLTLFTDEQEDEPNNDQKNDKNNCGLFWSFHNPHCFYCRNYNDPRGIDHLLTNQLRKNPESYSFLKKILGGEPHRGSTTAVLGAHHTFKLQASLDFLRDGSIKGEHGLLICLQDMKPELYKERASLCGWVCYKDKSEMEKCNNQKNCYGKVHSLLLRPGCISPEEFIFLLDNRLINGVRTGKHIQRIVFWDLQQISERFPFFAQDRFFLPALIDYLRNKWAIRAVFTGPASAEVSQQMNVLADNIVYAWREKWPLDGNPHQGQDMYAFYCDRLENEPSHSSLSYVPRLNHGERTGRTDRTDKKWDKDLFVPESSDSYTNSVGEVFIKESRTSQLMRQKIWEIQGIKAEDYVNTTLDRNSIEMMKKKVQEGE